MFTIDGNDAFDFSLKQRGILNKCQKSKIMLSDMAHHTVWMGCSYIVHIPRKLFLDLLSKAFTTISSQLTISLQRYCFFVLKIKQGSGYWQIEWVEYIAQNSCFSIPRLSPNCHSGSVCEGVRALSYTREGNEGAPSVRSSECR